MLALTLCLSGCSGHSGPVSEGPAGDDTVSIVMVGDVLLHDPINRTCHREDGTYDYSQLFENTRDEIEKADIAIVNQEAIIGGRELGVTGYPSFNAPYEIADELAATGFDVVCHANNHVYDQGETGLVNCITYWEQNHPNVMIVGISDRDNENKIPIIERKGIKFAVLNYTYGINGVNAPVGDRYAVNRLDENRVIKDLKRAGEEADFVIVCPHWGTEYETEASEEQRKWADIFLANGADLVIGTHPHVIEPVEWMGDDESKEKMLVYYSLGNYIGWPGGEGEEMAGRVIGGMASIRVSHNDQGDVTIDEYGVRALVSHLTKEKGKLTVYPLDDYTDRLAGSNEIIKKDTRFSKKYCVDMCNRIFRDIWY